MTGRIHSIQSLGTVDGPGVRSVVFLSGCPLRCAYCHNPDTWDMTAGEEIKSEALVERLLRFYPYIKNGGVTFSGGEPCLQAPFLRETARLLREAGLHIALDTSGQLWNAEVEQMLDEIDLVLLDLKFPTEEEYKTHTGGSLDRTLRFLDGLEARGIPVWIRQVTVPGLNDTCRSVEKTARLLSPYSCIERVELLPFRKLCLEKYESQGIPFPLSHVPEADPQRVRELERILEEFRKKP